MSDEPITVRKISSVVPMSVEMLLIHGVITEEQAREMGWTPSPPIPRLQRWRWAVRAWWWDHRPTFHLGPCNHEDCA